MIMPMSSASAGMVTHTPLCRVLCHPQAASLQPTAAAARPAEKSTEDAPQQLSRGLQLTKHPWGAGLAREPSHGVGVCKWWAVCGISVVCVVCGGYVCRGGMQPVRCVHAYVHRGVPAWSPIPHAPSHTPGVSCWRRKRRTCPCFQPWAASPTSAPPPSLVRNQVCCSKSKTRAVPELPGV